MNEFSDENLQRALILSEQLLRLADDGDAHREDVGCGILYGVLRDSAYRIRSLAQGEISVHKSKAVQSRAKLRCEP